MLISDRILWEGTDLKINKDITIHHPTLGEVLDYGEEKYFGLVSTICAVPQDCKYPLFEMGIDYETISEFDFFSMVAGGIEDTGVDFSGYVSAVDVRTNISFYIINKNNQL